MKIENFKIAYFSMEIALENNIKTYSGGLGILAGDILRSAADLRLPMVGVTLLSREGYFDQIINEKGEQEVMAAKNYDFSKLKKRREKVTINLGKEKLVIGVWEYTIRVFNGFKSPVFLLDTNYSKNTINNRNITNNLYGGDKEHRLIQETVLGRGGYKILKALGYNINKFHINEGHGSFVAVAKFLDSKKKSITDKVEETRTSCIFTTHTPMKMAHDVFVLDKVMQYQADFPTKLNGLLDGNMVNMTKIGLYFSHYINGVALSHRELSKKMFPGYPIHCITNGVHSMTWTAPEFKDLFDKYIPTWRHSSLSLRNAFSLSLDDIWQAHQGSKKRLIRLIKQRTGQTFQLNTFTIGFARRFTAYKRPTLIFRDMERLIKIHNEVGQLQIVVAGKAHPLDIEGQKLIKEVNDLATKYQKKIKIAFIEGYDMDLALTIIAGSDLWVNTPLPPNEASGTSGMKAAHNGVPQLSTFDGWWREGYIKGKTGWTIRGEKIKISGTIGDKDAFSFYNLLAEEIIPIYYSHPYKWRKIMRFAIGVNASFFNTERVIREYAQNAYL